MNSNSQASLEALDYQESLGDHLYDISLLGALTVVAVLSATMYRLPVLTGFMSAWFVGAFLCVPWALHQHKKLGKDKQATKAILRRLAIYTCLTAVAFAVEVRVMKFAAECLSGFLN